MLGCQVWGRVSSGRDGAETREPSAPPSGEFLTVSVSSGLPSSSVRVYACGIRPTGLAECWDGAYQAAYTPPGKFQSIDVGSRGACGVLTDQRIVCWDNPFAPGWSPYGTGTGLMGPGHPPPDGFRSVAIGAKLCVLYSDRSLDCAGFSRSELPSGEFRTIAAHEANYCGIQEDGSIVCWGDSEWAAIAPPQGHFEYVSIGPNYACTIVRDGTLTCWGSGKHAELLDHPGGKFKTVRAGDSFACGVSNSGGAICWGSRFGESYVQEGVFTDLPYTAPRSAGCARTRLCCAGPSPFRNR